MNEDFAEMQRRRRNESGLIALICAVSILLIYLAELVDSCLR